ncbi:MAG TPA: DUF4249 family protein [Candidatus Kapabacteria bacterium]|nr:DUF4249 family protein [Candidatus Kapabacteria bacterium]
MIRIRSVFVFLALAAIATGCENVVPATDLPYVNHIVIRGFLNADEPIDSISVTHTLPLSVQYDPNQAAIPNAQVSITVDGRSIPLQSIGLGFFTDPLHDTVQSGKTYSIDVQWNGLHAWASTLVPNPPAIPIFQFDNIGWDTEIYRYNSYYSDTFFSFGGTLEAGIEPVTAGEAYSLVYDSIADVDSNYSEASYYIGGDLYNLYPASEVNSAGFLPIFQFESLDPRDSNYFVSAVVESYDGAYYNFIKTYNNFGNSGDIFGTGGANPQWNISGDGIGIFIGTAETRRNSTFHR